MAREFRLMVRNSSLRDTDSTISRISRFSSSVNTIEPPAEVFRFFPAPGLRNQRFQNELKIHAPVCRD